MNSANLPLFGLVLAGGKSSRMGQDKSKMIYTQKPQFQVAYELLQQVCDRVFISSRLDQSETNTFGNYPLIIDRLEYQEKGPLGGILSAIKMHPQAAWMVLACDLPFVTVETLHYLLSQRNRNSMATAFRSAYDGLPEPLCSIWEPGHFSTINNLFSQGILCPRKILIKSNAYLCDVHIQGELDNINNPQEAKQALMRLRGRDA